MAVAVDLSGMTAGEMADLGAALGCTTFKQVQAKLLATGEMAKDGDLPLDMLVPMLWIARRATDPSFTLEQAATMPFTELAAAAAEILGPNAEGGQAAESSQGS